MDACILEMLVVLLRRYVRTEGEALAAGTHAHTLILQSLFYLYGWAHLGICRRTRITPKMPDLSPVLSVLPRDMREAITGSIAAELAGRHCDDCGDCIHQSPPSDYQLNVLESHYIWTIEEPPFKLN